MSGVNLMNSLLSDLKSLKKFVKHISSVRADVFESAFK